MGQRRRGGALAQLPAVTVARLEEAGRLLERLVEQNQSLFIEKGQEYRDAHREGTSRPLNAAEAAQLAVAMADDDAGGRVALAEQLQASALRAHDEPDGREVLLAAGVATAPQFVAAACDFVALVEMPVEQFAAAREASALPAAIAERSAELRELPLQDARERASRALAHYSAAAGVGDGAGEALRLLAGTVWQALSQAARHLDGGSRPSSLTGSPRSTAGDEPRSSTGPLGERPQS